MGEILAQGFLAIIQCAQKPDWHLDSLAEFVGILRDKSAKAFLDHWGTHRHPGAAGTP
jgi:esterase/lipase superfamily enzyme